ncbi:TIGR03084 family metal-binding protein [Mycobacterium syngnathidarum]
MAVLTSHPPGGAQAPPAPTTSQLLADLRSERTSLIGVLEEFDAATWTRPSEAHGWTIRDQAAHLAFYDRLAAVAVRDEAAFLRHREMALADVGRYERAHLDLVPGNIHALLASWTDAADEIERSVSTADSTARVPWFGPPMSLRSMITARLMETWVHGHDVRDAVNLPPATGDRLRHIADLAIRARPYGFIVREMTPPDDPVTIVLSGPDDAVWTWGSRDCGDRIEGAVEDFCLVLARRRHVDDTGIRCHGPAARAWMEFGQMYAGPPGDGPRRIQHSVPPTESRESRCQY